jgi:hypothetical protein
MGEALFSRTSGETLAAVLRLPLPPFDSADVPQERIVMTASTVIQSELPRTRQYSLFVHASRQHDHLASLLRQRIAASPLQEPLRIERKSSEEMALLALDAADRTAEVILERIIAGSTTVVIQFTTLDTVLAELDAVEASR